MPRRRACDRCCRLKEKCNFKEQAETCTRCERHASTCTTLRSQVRQGRRPKFIPLGSHGSVQIWDIGNVEGILTSTTRSQHLIGSLAPVSQSPSVASDIVEVQTSPSAVPETRISDGRIQVARTLAPIPLSQITESHKALVTYQPSTPNPYLLQITLESPFDIDAPWVVDRFYATYDLFMFGPSFARPFRTAIQQSYKCSPVLLHDVLRAIAPIMELVRHNPGLSSQVDIAKGTTSLQRLRTARVGRIQDAFAIIMLGQTLAAFDLLTYCIRPVLILRYSLSSIQPWYRELSRKSSLVPVTITPIFWDTVSCLVRREVPVIRTFSSDPYIVDRMAGLCTTLLPILYDLCVASNSLKCQLQSSSLLDTNPLGQIEQRLLAWMPEPPCDFSSTFSIQEILRMKAQASMYRTAALLVCHRILNPIGTLDDVAISYANSIMLDFSKYSALVGPVAILQNVAFPILMATLEISDVSKEIWKHVALSAAAPEFVAKISALVEYVWMERCCGFTGFIFDLVDNGPDFVVIP
jgi:hypothetical protein